MNIDYLIEYEGEGTNLDFKSTEYSKEQYSELLKDVIGMANAITDGDKLIIVGVKKLPDGSFIVKPLEQFTDSATYQQLVLSNVEPDLHIDYTPHHFKGKDLVGIIRISSFNDKPYMMKKAYGNRRLGESFVRKGTTIFPLTRKDVDRIFLQKHKQNSTSHKISFSFSEDTKVDSLDVKVSDVSERPSEKAAQRIKDIINKRVGDEKAREQQRIELTNKYNEAKESGSLQAGMLGIKLQLLSDEYRFKGLSLPMLGQSTPYEQRDLDTLRENLKNINETYKENDLYYILKKTARRINFFVINEGDKYLKDAVIEVRIDIVKGVIIADKIYEEPEYRSPYTVYTPKVNFEDLNYPKYTVRDNYYIFKESIGDLRHLQPQEVFRYPILAAVGKIAIGSRISIKVTLFGENLSTPIEDKLYINIIE